MNPNVSMERAKTPPKPLSPRAVIILHYVTALKSTSVRPVSRSATSEAVSRGAERSSAYRSPLPLPVLLLGPEQG